MVNPISKSLNIENNEQKSSYKILNTSALDRRVKECTGQILNNYCESPSSGPNCPRNCGDGYDG